MPEEGFLMSHFGKSYRVLYFDATVGKDMAQFDATLAEHLSDQEPSVAVSRLTAAAHQGKTVSLRSGQQTIYSFLERTLFGHPAVEGVTGRVVVRVVPWPSSQGNTKKYVADAAFLDSALQPVPVEVRCDSRIGERPHVEQKLDLFGADQLGKPLEVVV